MMTHEEVIAMMGETGIPFDYDHFAEGEAPAPPFITFLYLESNNFTADSVVYFRKNKLHVELYTDRKKPEREAAVEAVLDAHGLFYNKNEVWISEERLYEVLYEMEV